uniref:Retrotransposon gag domain-containing protein n=1 Tax=Cannabis sativa TaxID=3483 RepID=A0A803P5C3_CANSA
MARGGRTQTHTRNNEAGENVNRFEVLDEHNKFPSNDSRTLLARNKIKFVVGRLPAPDKDNENYESWIRCNNLEKFHQKNAPRIFKVKRSMQTLTQGSNDVTYYYTKLKGLWDLLQEYRPQPDCTCGAMKTIHEYQDEDKVLEFLIGLNESYLNAQSQILFQDPLPNVNKAYASII